MSWTFKNDTLFDKNGKDICFFLPGANDGAVRMIKNCEAIIHLIGEFVQAYDEKQKAKKKLLDEFENIVDLNANYNFVWSISWEGNLVDNNDNIVCILSDKNSLNAKMIKALPQTFQASQELILTFKASSNVKQKPAYEKICKIYDEISEL